MKNKIFKILTACALIVVSLLTLVACNEGHKHNFTVKNVDQTYLASAVSCTQAATYYYSCECGEKGGATYTVGKPQHSYDAAHVCQACGTTEIYTPGLDIRLSTDGTYAAVWGFGEVSGLDRIIIPSTHEGKPVTKILTMAFQNCPASTIELPGTLIEIGMSAFKNCSNLQSIIFPASVTSIGSSCFSGCTRLATAKFEDPYGWQGGKFGTFSPIELSTTQDAEKVADMLVQNSSAAWAKK